MLKKGVRVVIVDEQRAQAVGAKVYNKEKGTIGAPYCLNYVYVHMDGDTGPMAWAMPASCVKRLHEAKVK